MLQSLDHDVGDRLELILHDLVQLVIKQHRDSLDQPMLNLHRPFGILGIDLRAHIDEDQQIVGEVVDDDVKTSLDEHVQSVNRILDDRLGVVN